MVSYLPERFVPRFPKASSECKPDSVALHVKIAKTSFFFKAQAEMLNASQGDSSRPPLPLPAPLASPGRSDEQRNTHDAIVGSASVVSNVAIGSATGFDSQVRARVFHEQHDGIHPLLALFERPSHRHAVDARRGWGRASHDRRRRQYWNRFGCATVTDTFANRARI